jgi:hypothetical protein
MSSRNGVVGVIDSGDGITGLRISRTPGGGPTRFAESVRPPFTARETKFSEAAKLNETLTPAGKKLLKPQA